jgi:hypothetical protein
VHFAASIAVSIAASIAASGCRLAGQNILMLQFCPIKTNLGIEGLNS